MSVVDISEVAIEKLRQEVQRGLQLDLFTMNAAEYEFETRRYDLIVLFYHFDRTLFPKIVSALNPGGLLVCKMAIHWNSEIEVSATPDNPLRRSEILSLVPELHVMLLIIRSGQYAVEALSNLWEPSLRVLEQAARSLAHSFLMG